MKKHITPEVYDAIKGLVVTQIPQHLQKKALTLNINEVYFFNTNLSDYGIYGNSIVLLKNGQYIDIQIIPNNIEALFQLL